MHIIQQEIGLPKITAKKIGDNHTLFTVAPLPSGYGMTLGNTFRRVLLSSLPGAAITAVKVKGINHEYTTLAGVSDDVLNILLNLKEVNLRKHGSEPTELKLEVKGKTGEVKAADIEKNSDVEIANPDFVITNLDKKGDLKMELRVEKGVGYLPAAERQAKNKEVGLIFLDATFSPVERVRYDVSNTRVGDMTDLDKLEMEVVTNGSMTPEESVKFASDVIKSYFDLFNKDNEAIEEDFIADSEKMKQTKNETVIGADEKEEEELNGLSTEKYTPIETLQFSPRTLNALINGGIGSIEQLTKWKPSRLNELRGLGNKAIDEINEKLTEKNLSLADED